jgi:hypothetical protein
VCVVFPGRMLDTLLSGRIPCVGSILPFTPAVPKLGVCAVCVWRGLLWRAARVCARSCPKLHACMGMLTRVRARLPPPSVSTTRVRARLPPPSVSTTGTRMLAHGQARALTRVSARAYASARISFARACARVRACVRACVPSCASMHALVCVCAVVSVHACVRAFMCVRGCAR